MTKPITLPIISFTVCVLCLFQYCRYIFVPCNKTITKLWWLIPIETFQFSQQLKQQLRIKMFNINYMFINFLFLYVIILHLDQYFDRFYTYTINMLKFIRKYSYIWTLFILNDVSSKIENCDLAIKRAIVIWLSVLATS